jgi:hypothetical protein
MMHLSIPAVEVGTADPLVTEALTEAETEAEAEEEAARAPVMRRAKVTMNFIFFCIR